MNRSEAIARLAALEVSSLAPGQRADALMDAWGLSDAHPAWAGLPDDVQRELSEWSCDDERIDALDARYDALLEAVAGLRWRGVTNEHLSSCLHLQGIRPDEVTGNVEPLQACPVCGFRTLERSASYDICRLSGWEDDGVRDEATHSGPNHATLGSARARWLDQAARDPELLRKFHR